MPHLRIRCRRGLPKRIGRRHLAVQVSRRKGPGDGMRLPWLRVVLVVALVAAWLQVDTYRDERAERVHLQVEAGLRADVHGLEAQLADVEAARDELRRELGIAREETARERDSCSQELSHAEARCRAELEACGAGE